MTTRYRKPLTTEEERIARADTGYVKSRCFYGNGESHRIKGLSEHLEISYAAALGIVHMFWHWATEYCVEGDLRAQSNESMASSIRGSGLQIGPDLFVQALIDARIIEESPYLRITDWWSIAEETIKKRLQFRSPYFLTRVRKSYEALTKKELEETAEREIRILDRDLVAAQVADISQALGLPAPRQEVIAQVTGEKRLPPNVGARFLHGFKHIYEASNPGHQMLLTQKDFLFVSKLIKDMGLEDVIQKARHLAYACRAGTYWWSKTWGAFSVWTLCNRWNEILPPPNDDKIKAEDFMRKFKQYMTERADERIKYKL